MLELGAAYPTAGRPTRRGAGAAPLGALRRRRSAGGQPFAAERWPWKHGPKFDFNDPTTWPSPTAEPAVEDEQDGDVRVRAWSNLHPKQQAHATRGTRKPRPVVRGALVLVEVSRLPACPGLPVPAPGALTLVGRAWGARPGHSLSGLLTALPPGACAPLLHAGLGWTTPSPCRPERANRWTWSVTAVYTHLRPACVWLAARRLPWERALGRAKLTPIRISRASSALPFILGTPADALKPQG